MKKLAVNRTRLFGGLAVALLSFGWAIQGADVSDYAIKKGTEYSQSSDLLVFDATNGYVFDAYVNLSAPNLARSASLLVPGSNTWLELPMSSTADQFEYKHKYNTEKTLTKHFSDGTYRFYIDAINDKVQNISLSLPYSIYPDGPHIRDFSATQQVNANGYVQINWDPFYGGTTNDFVQFRVEDASGNRLYETPDFGKMGAYDGTATRAVIAPGSLPLGAACRATLRFETPVIIDRASYPGALGASACYARTEFQLTTGNAPAPDVKYGEVIKGRRWVQTNDTSVLPEVGKEYFFNAVIHAYTNNTLSNVTVQLPASTNGTELSQLDGLTWDFTEFVSTESLLNSFYTNGNFVLNFSAIHDGKQKITLPLPSSAYPPAPRVMQYADLQSVDATNALTIAWDRWQGGTVNDYIKIKIEDEQNNEAFETSLLGKIRALNGLATNTVVPPNTLIPGVKYHVTIAFQHIIGLDTTSYPAVLGLSIYESRTKIPLITTGKTPVMTLTLIPSSRQIQVSAPVLPGKMYRMEGSTNLSQWNPLSTVIASNYYWLFVDTNSASSPRFFYRTVALP